MLKIDNNLKWTQKQNLCMLSKVVLLVCPFYKLEYLSCIGVVLSKFCKRLFAVLLHHVLGVIRIDVLNQSCSISNLVFACKKFLTIASLNLELHPSKRTQVLMFFRNQHPKLASFHLVPKWSSSTLSTKKVPPNLAKLPRNWKFLDFGF
jgi:hypothetical protein